VAVAGKTIMAGLYVETLSSAAPAIESCSAAETVVRPDMLLEVAETLEWTALERAALAISSSAP
jgi:hypothetical protein